MVAAAAVLATGCDWLTHDLQGQVFIVQKNGISVKLGLVDIYGVSEEELRAHILKKSQEGQDAQAKIKDRYIASKAYIEKTNNALIEVRKTMAETEATVNEGGRSGGMKNPQQVLQAMLMVQEMKTNLLPKIEAEAAKAINTERKVVDEYEGFDRPGYYLASIPGLKGLGKTDAEGKFSVRIPLGNTVIVAHGQRTVSDHVEDYYWAIKSNGVDLKKDLYLSNDNLIETRCPSCMLTSGK
jgi:hypothetical protein